VGEVPFGKALEGHLESVHLSALLLQPLKFLIIPFRKEF
jgi:hypothetical protein